MLEIINPAIQTNAFFGWESSACDIDQWQKLHERTGYYQLQGNRAHPLSQHQLWTCCYRLCCINKLERSQQMWTSNYKAAVRRNFGTSQEHDWNNYWISKVSLSYPGNWKMHQTSNWCYLCVMKIKEMDLQARLESRSFIKTFYKSDLTVM